MANYTCGECQGGCLFRLAVNTEGFTLTCVQYLQDIRAVAANVFTPSTPQPPPTWDSEVIHNALITTGHTKVSSRCGSGSTMSKISTSLVATPSKVISNLIPSPPKSTTASAEIPPSPGTFRHPRLTEIIKRQSASSLTSQKIQYAIINITAIAVTFMFNNTLDNLIRTLLMAASIRSSTLNASTLILFVRLLFLTNIILCLRPVLPYVSQKDDVVDIPLTPTQRALLGLPASNQRSPAPSAGDAGYVTPPRYRRDGGMSPSTSLQNSPAAFSSTWRSISANHPASSAGASHHTLGFSPSPQQNGAQSARTYRRTSNSPFVGSPSGSPLLNKAVTNDFKQSTFTTAGGRASLGMSASTLGFSLSRSQSVRDQNSGFEDANMVPGTPSPSGPKRQPGVNYKWLYDKGARLPRSESTGF